MAVSGAFVFAAQMMNFTIPGTGSSGHIGGGILLETTGKVFENAEAVQNATAFMPGYDYRNAPEETASGTSVAGIAGA
jgi:hypothetical protein